MSSRTRVTVGTLLLLPLLALVLLTLSWSQGPWRWAGAAQPESSWTSPYDISQPTDPQTNASQKPRAVLAPDTYLHVTWMEGVMNAATGPAYAKGQGTSWSAWEWAAPHNNPGYVNPVIALDSHGTIHIAWGGGGGSPYDIYYANKPAGGAWSSPENLSNESYNTVKPSIAIDSQDRLWVAWQASHTDNDEEIYVRSKPYGGSWETAMRVTSRSAADQDPSIVIDASDVPHLAWRSNDPGNWEVVYTRYAGGAWLPIENVSASSRGSHFPRLAADNVGNVWVAWEEETGADEFQTAVRRWNSGSWGSRTFASLAGIKALYPDIGVDDVGVVYVAWTDYRSTPTEVYFNHSTDYGNTWVLEENVSKNGSASFFPNVVSQAGGTAHIFWQDTAPGSLDIYYSKATIPGIVTPTPVSPTPAIPYGGLNVVALQPPANQQFTRQLAVQLNLWATSPAGHALLMRYDNNANFSGNPTYVAFASAVPSWNLAATPGTCAIKTVYAQYKDAVDGTESPVYSDPILFDDWLTATLTLNGGNAYTNRTMVKLDTGNSDLSAGCSGLYAMQFREPTITYTTWYSYLPGLWYYLQPDGAATRTVYGHYLDKAGNEGTYSRQITFDLDPPYNGTAPTMPASTNKLLVSVSNLQATDDASGVGYIWLANNCSAQGEGAWLAVPYCSSPPCTVVWNLGYGGPPLDGLNRVCVKYEDRSGYGSFRGNFSSIYEGTITVTGIDSVLLPLVVRRYTGAQAYVVPTTPADDDLFLWADPPQAGPDGEVLLYLVLPGSPDGPREGTLRMQLPAGLRVVRAWSAYGELQYVGTGEVRSLERAAPGRAAWLTVLARVVPGAGPHLPVQGELRGADGTSVAPRLWVESR